MNGFRFKMGMGGWILAVAGMTILATGCVSTGGSRSGGGAAISGNEVASLRANDPLTIVFSGVPNPPDKFDGQIKEDGTISLPYLREPVKAAGKTTGQLQKEIHDLYVPSFFVRLSVNVDSPSRFVYIFGEVKLPSRQLHLGQMTVLGAIAASGGFTDFAAKTRVELTRGSGEVLRINCNKARNDQSLDLPVFPGDKINVPRRGW